MNTTTLIPDPYQSALVVTGPGSVTIGAANALDVEDDHKPAFAVLVRTELRKMRDTRSGTAILALIAAFSIGVPIVLLISLATGGIDSLSYFDFVFGAEASVRLLLPVLVVLLVTSEWSQRSAMTTFALVPNRGRVLAAKFVAALVATLVALAAVLTIAALANLASSAFGNSQLRWDIDWTSFGTYGLDYLYDTVLAFALGVALLSSAAGLVAYFVIQAGMSAVMYGLSQISWFEPIVPWIDPTAIVEVDFEPSVGSNWAHLAVSSLIWIGIPLVVGIRRVLTTEIK